MALAGLPLLFATGSAEANQLSPAQQTELDSLFTLLHDAPDAATATQLDQRIWQIWMSPPDTTLTGSMQREQADETAGDIPAALAVLGTVTKDYPDYAEGWNRRATLEFQQGQFDASLADIGKTLAVEPRHFGALSGEVLIYLAKGDRGKALTTLLAALRIHPFLSEKGLFPELTNPDVKI